ncbi:MAG: hypothetical protein KAS38_12330, partial [Anaerolineales bacterium]|nr:hypothetical protein [Anaerolineales bacterium]
QHECPHKFYKETSQSTSTQGPTIAAIPFETKLGQPNPNITHARAHGIVTGFGDREIYVDMDKDSCPGFEEER